jgi:hypothetical protein
LTFIYLIGHSTFSFAQGQYPNRPIKLIIPFPPAGPTDIFARQYAQALSNILNTPVITENKGGAAGVIGAVEAKRSTPDGYTLLFGTVTTHGLYSLLSNKLDEIAGCIIKKYTGKYDKDSNPLYTNGELFCETVYRFKGQSSPVVIFFEIDFVELSVRELRKLFVGMSRAQDHLICITSQEAESKLLERIKSLN